MLLVNQSYMESNPTHPSHFPILASFESFLKRDQRIPRPTRLFHFLFTVQMQIILPFLRNSTIYFHISKINNFIQYNYLFTFF